VEFVQGVFLYDISEVGCILICRWLLLPREVIIIFHINIISLVCIELMSVWVFFMVLKGNAVFVFKCSRDTLTRGVSLVN
jgi:hypothetical protein